MTGPPGARLRGPGDPRGPRPLQGSPPRVCGRKALPQAAPAKLAPRGSLSVIRAHARDIPRSRCARTAPPVWSPPYSTPPRFSPGRRALCPREILKRMVGVRGRRGVQFARGAGARAACRRACARAPRPRARSSPRALPLPLPFPLAAASHAFGVRRCCINTHASRGSAPTTRIEATLPPSDGSSCASAVSTRRARVHPRSRSSSVWVRRATAAGGWRVGVANPPSLHAISDARDMASRGGSTCW